MIQMRNALIALQNDRGGAAALEYTLMAALIGIAVLSVSGILGYSMANVFTQISGALAAGTDLLAQI